MFISDLPVIHMIYEPTQYSAASFLKSPSANDICLEIQRLWTCTYKGPPDYLIVDQESSYIYKDMIGALTADEVQLWEAPIESLFIWPHSLATGWVFKEKRKRYNLEDKKLTAGQKGRFN